MLLNIVAGRARATWWLRLCCLVCWGCLPPGIVEAGSHWRVSLPSGGAKITTGLNLEIESNWLDGNGYRPVTLRISTIGKTPAPADRHLQVTLQPTDWHGGNGPTSVSTAVSLKQGQVQAEYQLQIPQSHVWNTLDVTVFEDGRRCDDLSEYMVPSSRGYREWSEASPAILFIDSDAPIGGGTQRFVATGTKATQPEKLPDIRALAMLFPYMLSNGALTPEELNTATATDDNGILKMVSLLSRFELVSPMALPSNWINYTSVDMVFISLEDLRLVARQSERWSALRSWLAAGSTMCVYGLGTEFEQLAELEALLQLPDLGSAVDAESRGWRAPSSQGYGTEVVAFRDARWNQQWHDPATGENLLAAGTTPKARVPDQPRPFLIRGVECGRVVALAATNPFPGQREDWIWLLNSLNKEDYMWYQRHGLSLQRENPQFWDLMIPGVGAAPVNSFLVLISLFVIVIGPVNYFLLQRKQRLYLLLVTVPLGAAIVTLALLLYAVFSDGLGVRWRGRSLTRLNQTNGQTVTWSRQSYYAGLAPSTGLSFPRDAAILMIDHFPTGAYGQPRDFGRRIEWGADQRLRRGFLNSRTTSQMMVVESRPTSLRVEVHEPDNAEGELCVSNQLGVDVQKLLLCDANSRWFTGQNLPREQSVALSEVTPREFLVDWNKMFADQRPRYPIGFDPHQIENASAIFGVSTNWWYYGDSGLPEPSTTTSILEREMHRLGGLKADTLPRRSYVAVVNSPPNGSRGLAVVREEGGFHIVVGNW